MELKQPLDGLDLDAYFQRIRYEGDRVPTLETLRAIHQQHAQTINIASDRGSG